ncbi:MAG: hypothetical protein M1829_002185 [Trizodia sp. TS-e1964]|nr:MAG: hypothetical protein M1829_002185 [Trizodia sp. TS-e1964]
MFNYDNLPLNLPRIETRQALLILDLQNDFVSINSKLPVSSQAGFVDNIKSLVPTFRNSGDIFWVKSEYQAPRLFNNTVGESESVITNAELPSNSPHPSTVQAPQARSHRSNRRVQDLYNAVAARYGDELLKTLSPSPDPEEQNETFLSISSTGRAPVCCLPGTLGARFADSISPLIDHTKDMIITKSHYSAFHSTNLLQALRGSLVTDLFVCGLISNIGVYATVLDAARYGFSITLLQDCLGYRDQKRHNEAVKQMTDVMGADLMPSNELIAEIGGELSNLDRATTSTVREATDQPSLNPMPDTSKQKSASPATQTDSALLPLEATGQQASKNSSASTTSITILDETALVPTKEVQKVTSKEQDLTKADLTHEDIQEQASNQALSSISPKHGKDMPEDKANPPKVDNCSDGNAAEIPKIREKSPSPKNSDKKGSSFLPPDEADQPAISLSADNNQSCEISQPKSNDNPLDSPLPTPTFGVLSAATVALAEIALNPTAYSSKPTSTIPIVTPTAVETARAQSIRPVNRVKRTHIRAPSVPSLGPEDIIGEGDSRIVHNFMDAPLCETAFECVRKEVQWQTMHHRGGDVPRLVAVQGDIASDGSVPIYRHPADESPPLLPFSPTVKIIKEKVEGVLNQPVNHVLIQHYRNGNDYISEHSDKTLDILRGSSIVNVSIGAQRTMTLRTKKLKGLIASESPNGSGLNVSELSENPEKRIINTSNKSPTEGTTIPRQVQRIKLPHNSMFVLGQITNMRWLHAIRQDKRLITAKSAEENAYNGERISLTFRHIGTFLNRDHSKIWGQGATGKSSHDGGLVVNGASPQSDQMIKAFGDENQLNEFDWNAIYGKGFDVLDMVTKKPRLLSSGDLIAELRVKLCLAEKGIEWEDEALPLPPRHCEDSEKHLDISCGKASIKSLVKFVDIGIEASEIHGDLAIISYLEELYRSSPYTSLLPHKDRRGEIGRVMSMFQEAEHLLKHWQSTCDVMAIPTSNSNTASPNSLVNGRHLTSGNHKAQKSCVISSLRNELSRWESYCTHGKYIAGSEGLTLADISFWPVLHTIIEEWVDWDVTGFERLAEYDERMLGRGNVKVVLALDHIMASVETEIGKDIPSEQKISGETKG